LSDLISRITSAENSGSKPFCRMAATAVLRRVCVGDALSINGYQRNLYSRIEAMTIARRRMTYV